MCEKEGRSSLIHPLRVSGKCRDKKETKRKPNIYQNILFILASGIELVLVLGSLERNFELHTIKSKKVIGKLWCLKLEVTHLGGLSKDSRVEPRSIPL